MLPTKLPSIQETIKAISRLEFWYGILIATVITHGLTNYYNQISYKYLNITIQQKDHELKNIKLVKKLELKKLAHQYSTLESKHNKLIEHLSKYKKSGRIYCKEQVRLIRLLQKNHKLESRLLSKHNYEYLSILEKVMFKLDEYSESCDKAMSQR